MTYDHCHFIDRILLFSLSLRYYYYLEDKCLFECWYNCNSLHKACNWLSSWEMNGKLYTDIITHIAEFLYVLLCPHYVSLYTYKYTCEFHIRTRAIYEIEKCTERKWRRTILLLLWGHSHSHVDHAWFNRSWKEKNVATVKMNSSSSLSSVAISLSLWFYMLLLLEHHIIYTFHSFYSVIGRPRKIEQQQKKQWATTKEEKVKCIGMNNIFSRFHVAWQLCAFPRSITDSVCI